MWVTNVLSALTMNSLFPSHHSYNETNRSWQWMYLYLFSEYHTKVWSRFTGTKLSHSNPMDLIVNAHSSLTFFQSIFILSLELKLRNCNLHWYIIKVILWYILGDGISQCQSVCLPCVGLCVWFFSIPPQTHLLLVLLLSRYGNALSPCRDLHPVPVHYHARCGKIHWQALWPLTE